MVSSPSDNFAKMFLPEHPHLRLHILLSILAFVAVVGSVVAYQTKKAHMPENFAIPDIQDSSQARIAKLEEVSRSLQIQAQTPEFKAKLDQMAQSLSNQ